MITSIFNVYSQRGLDALGQNLFSLQLLGEYSTVLCEVVDEDLYLECRELFDNFYEGESLVTLATQADLLRDAAEKLGDRNDFVFVCSTDLILPIDILERLYEDFTKKPHAGFITALLGDFPNSFMVSGLYDKDPTMTALHVNLDASLSEIDAVRPPYAFMSRTDLFKESVLSDDPDKEYYGLSLRRQGYRNYADTGLKLRFRR